MDGIRKDIIMSEEKKGLGIADMQAMFEAANSGKSARDVYEAGNLEEPQNESVVVENSISDSADGESTPIESLLADKFGENTQETSSEESTQNDLPPSDAADATDLGNQKLPEAIETVTVTDSKGRKKNIKVDFNDREQLKKFVHMSAGMRKFQAERDALKKQLMELGDTSEVSDKVRLFDELDTIYQTDGSAGLINRLAGNEEAYDALRQEIIDEYEMRRTASPSELARMDYEKERTRQARELERIRMENEQFKQSVQEREHQASVKSIQAIANNSFNKHRFAGKLDDPDQEHHLDSAIWVAARAELEDLELKGVEISNQVIEKVFRDKAVPFKKYINKQSRKKLKNAITKKKRESASNIQSQIKNSMSNGNNVDQSKLAEEFKKGRGTSALLDLWAQAQQSKRRK